MTMFTRPGFDRDDTLVLESIAPFGPGRVNNDLGTEGGFVVPGSCRITEEQRFWTKVNRDGPVPDYRPDLGPCWLWTGGRKNRGYGLFMMNSGPQRCNIAAHRWSYQHVVGAIPDGLQLDHLCRVRACVNPSHLEPVTCAENLYRSNVFHNRGQAKTHCDYGHEFTPENTYMHGTDRQCRPCNTRRARERRARLSRERLEKRSA